MTATFYFIDAFFGHSLQDQFYFTASFSILAFVCAIILREFCKADWAKGCGRLLGLGGFFLLLCYAFHATDVATRMEQIAATRANEVNEEAVLFAAKQTSITTKQGNTIDWITFTDQSRSVPFVRGRARRVTGQPGRTAAVDSGSDCCAGELPRGASAADL